jgi:hypothetical protein
LAVPQTIDKTWSTDIIHDQLANGRSYQLLNVINTYDREERCIEVVNAETRTDHAGLTTTFNFN